MMKERNEVVSISGRKFSQWETQGLRVNVKRWKDKYLYTDMHETFFVEFPYLLYEWMKRKTATNTALRPLEPIVWDQSTG
jgi:hypothetical protein